MFQRSRVSRFVHSTMILTSVSLAGSSLVACNKDGEGKGEAEVEETGVDFQNNPISAMGKLAEVGQQMQAKHEEMAKRKPVDPLPFGELIVLLPKVDGWTSPDEAKGETTQMGEYKITTVSQHYSRITGDKTENMSVTILDGGYVPMVYAPFLMMSQFSREGTDGHSKGLTISGQPAFEEWKKAQESVNLSILVADRFLVTLNGDSVAPEEGRTWAGHIKLNQLKDLALKSAK
jgi:hypothetical protein